MTRRGFLATTAAALGLGASQGGAAESFEVSRSEAEWRAMLSDLEYRVMREEATERAYTSPLNDENRAGRFLCKGCELPLYASETKFDSGTGWPSFYEALPNAVETKPDRSLFMVRTECHCRRCGSHLGHIFDDGPPPTGKRHCINGVSLTFRAAG
ncbi:MAG: peptide-methionine (R)-S-oxide reductase [Rhodobacteraceae bacterium]|uniref:peptide-methionine (R)-S-oxide reductase n=1 Tax=Salipiger profundus TaxID=1229727 RepID=A0A1U7DCC2_9RHOB|nr:MULTISPECIES: peptide-methionine (R)-S-oxide reductase MsrB [Salipiger]APX25695.1 peptide-methionine (R)-S-oxide reductase [Salipiger profundus]MAB06372.1 peptide-methionine (R)-S-oxide reductase [Paracoccaceae bacterium]GGA04009.1 peptide-methionine (R)-S-oxide reductase [Salipiger profundus]SFD55762.1 peptide-methionine (R)-S-oxide reductase [Salipiger profundus]